MTAPRKTPRSDAMWRKYYDESADESDMKELMCALEIETQELAEALSKIADVSCRESSLMVARAALASHRNKQGGAA